MIFEHSARLYHDNNDWFALLFVDDLPEHEPPLPNAWREPRPARHELYATPKYGSVQMVQHNMQQMVAAARRASWELHTIVANWRSDHA